MRSRFAPASLLALVPLASLTAAGCADIVHGNGTVRTETRAVPDFAKVEVHAALVTEIVRAEEPGVRLEADENLLGLLIARVEGDTLILDVAEDDVVLEPTAPMTAIVSTGTLAAVKNHASEVVSLSGWQVAALELDTVGAGGLKAADLEIGDLRVTSSGAGDVVLGGTTEVLRLESSGAGAVDAHELAAGRVDVDVSGAGDVTIKTDGTVDGTLHGEGDLIVTGDPTRIDVEDLGGGAVSIR